MALIVIVMLLVLLRMMMMMIVDMLSVSTVFLICFNGVGSAHAVCVCDRIHMMFSIGACSGIGCIHGKHILTALLS